nr:hypothetical protein Iba_chr04cCG8430 [Ipomoea batatas]
MAAFESYMWTKFSHLDSRLYEMFSTRQSTWSTRARWIWSPRLTRLVKTSYSIISRNTSLATWFYPFTFAYKCYDLKSFFDV